MVPRRVVGMDSAFLAGETPEWHFHVAALQIIDPSTTTDFGFETFRQVCKRRIHLVPHFRWKLVTPPLRLGWSYFVDDPDFELDDHLHHISLPAPGGRAELDCLVGELVGLKIDRRRALWEMWFIDGLAHERVAILTKVHHSIIDGTSGVDVAAALYDLTPDLRDSAAAPVYEPSPIPSPLELSMRNAVNFVGVPLRMARLGREYLRQGAVSLPLALGEHRPSLPFQAPRTMFNGQLTARRGFASVGLPLGLLRQIKGAAGVTLNDVVLAVCAGALRSYLVGHGELPDKALLAQVPVSTRAASSRADVGTRVGTMFVSLATHIADPVERLTRIHDNATSAKALAAARSGHGGVGLTDALPPALVSFAARAWSMARLDAWTPPIYNVIISNITGPSVDFYVAGAKIEAVYPIGPLLYGSGLNITAFSNGGTLDIGIVTSRELLPDPWLLADTFAPALDELADVIVGTSLSSDGMG